MIHLQRRPIAVLFGVAFILSTALLLFAGSYLGTVSQIESGNNTSQLDQLDQLYQLDPPNYITSSDMLDCLKNTHKRWFKLPWSSRLATRAYSMLERDRRCDGEAVSDDDSSDDDDDMSICALIRQCDDYISKGRVRRIRKVDGEVGCAVKDYTPNLRYKWVLCVYEDDD
ncbi:uncharacterized protein LOC134824939 isoform X2 [Bolinopsis microptera]|uniref:uncharacterized protein LOC134824939 isoform X2 n=1 Tax=Bolinopsis microptera TaxID=2820187 RepID=UPI00307A377B